MGFKSQPLSTVTDACGGSTETWLPLHPQAGTGTQRPPPRPPTPDVTVALWGTAWPSLPPAQMGNGLREVRSFARRWDRAGFKPGLALGSRSVACAGCPAAPWGGAPGVSGQPQAVPVWD